MIKGMGVKHVIVRVSMTSAGSLVSVFSCLCACVCVRLMCCLTLKHFKPALSDFSTHKAHRKHLSL